MNLLAGRGNEKQVASHINTIKKIFGVDAYKKLRRKIIYFWGSVSLKDFLTHL